MTPEIEKQIVSLIEAAKQAGSDASSFIAAQAPDVILQLVRWKICEGVIMSVLGVAALWSTVKLFKLTWRKVEDEHVDEYIWIPSGLALFILSLGGCILAYDGITQTAKAIFAPKVLIIEMVVDLSGHK
jgi:hypothetical protein